MKRPRAGLSRSAFEAKRLLTSAQAASDPMTAAVPQSRREGALDATLRREPNCRIAAGMERLSKRVMVMVRVLRVQSRRPVWRPHAAVHQPAARTIVPPACDPL